MTDETHPESANRALIERFFAASERGDLVELRADVLGAMQAVEVKPQFAGRPRLLGSGDLWVLMVPLRYGEEVLQYVAVLELEAGTVGRATGYWGSAFPPQEARARFADKTP